MQELRLKIESLEAQKQKESSLEAQKLSLKLNLKHVNNTFQMIKFLKFHSNNNDSSHEL